MLSEDFPDGFFDWVEKDSKRKTRYCAAWDEIDKAILSQGDDESLTHASRGDMLMRKLYEEMQGKSLK